MAVLLLALCCVFWGLSFPVMKHCIQSVERHVAGLAAAGQAEPGDSLSFSTKFGINAAFNGWRFCLAALCYWILTRKRQRGFSALEVRGGLWIGGLFTLGMFAQLGGLRYTRPSVSGFLTSLVVVYTPVAQALVFRRRVGAQIWLAVVIALVGMTLLSLPNPDANLKEATSHTAPIPFLGEALTMLCALIFTGQMLAVDHFGKQADTTKLTLLMFVTLGVLSTAVGIYFAGRELYAGPVVSAMLADRWLVAGVLSLVLFSSVIALHLMNTYQPHVSPAMASVVYCLEPVFATLFSLLFGLEALTIMTLGGGVVILAAVLIVARGTADPKTQASGAG